MSYLRNGYIHELLRLEIVWTARAAKGFDRIIRQIEKQWTEREVRNFIKDIRLIINYK